MFPSAVPKKNWLDCFQSRDLKLCSVRITLFCVEFLAGKPKGVGGGEIGVPTTEQI